MSISFCGVVFKHDHEANGATIAECAM